MAGREDFAIVRARLLADPRTHKAAQLYIAEGLAVPATALATVVGHVAMLGIWATRETDDGTLGLEPEIPVGIACLVPATDPLTAKYIVHHLTTAGLLKRKGRKGLYVAGFADCYEPLIRRRERNRENAAAARQRARVADVASDVSDHRTGPDRTGKIPPTPRTRRNRRSLQDVLDYVAACGAGGQRHEAIEARNALRAGALDEGARRQLLEVRFRWVTAERIARWKRGG